MKERIMKKGNQILIVILIIEILFSCILLNISSSLFSYASDEINIDNKTNNENILFSAKLKENDVFMNSNDMNLIIDIEVKNEGFFNGEINLDNSNFVFKDDLKEGMEAIEENKIILKQISATSKISLEVKIQPIKTDNYRLEFLSKETDIKLTGQYTTNTNSIIDINTTKKVKLSLKNPYINEGEDYTDFKTEIITNKIFNINNENKRIVQIYIKNGIRDNIYPIKSSVLKMSIPQEVEQVEVLSRGTFATNGKAENEFTEEQWNYDNQLGILTIITENIAQDGNVSWVKDKKDEFIVNLVFDEQETLNNKSIKTESEIRLYDETSVYKKDIVIESISEEKSAVIDYSVTPLQSEIPKGKLYSKEETEFKILEKIDIRYGQISKNIVISKEFPQYILTEESQTMNANVGYINSKLKKDEINRLLGEEGKLIIKNSQGQEIAIIDKNVESNENGDIVINYENTDGVILEIQNPENQGIISIEDTMFIKEENYNYNQLKDIQKLKINAQLKDINNAQEILRESEIILKDSITKAEIQVDEDKLFTETVNEDVEIKITLNTNGSEYDLYQNPIFQVIFPREVQNVEINRINLMYGENLQIEESKVLENENGQKIIQLKLQGKQEKHLESDIIKGANIIINCDIALNSNIGVDNGTILMKYRNQLNENQYKTESAETNIKYLLSLDNTDILMATVNNTEENISNIEINKEISNGDGQDIYQRQVQKFTLTIKNNTTEEIQNIIIKDPIPEGMVYATETGSEALENTWIEHADIKEYTYTIDKLEPNSQIKLDYWAIPLKSNDNIGKVVGTKATATVGENIYESNLLQNTIREADLQIELTTRENTTTGYFSEAEDVNYIIKVKNLTSSDMNDIEIKNVIPEGLEYESSSYLQKNETGYYEDLNNPLINENYDDTTKTVIWNIENLKPGEEKAVKVTAILQEVTTEEEYIFIENQASASVNNKEYKSNELSIKQYNRNVISVKLESTLTDTYLYENQEFQYIVTVTNNNPETGSSYELVDILPDGLTLNEVSYMINEEEVVMSGIENVELSLSIPANTSQKIVITVTADELEEGVEELEIRNIINITGSQIKEVNSNELVNIVRKEVQSEEPDEPTEPDEPINPDEPAEPEDPDNPTNPDNPDEPTNPNDPNEPTISEDYRISGIAWLDENENGAREETEKRISGIEVRLVDSSSLNYVRDDSGNIIKQTTGENGEYSFTNLKQGQYIVVFVYDTSKYSITQYQQLGINEALNSDAVKGTINENGLNLNVGLTNSVSISTKNIENIDIGLLENKIFDLKIDKYINQIEVREGKSTRVYQYNNVNLTKVEIDSKNANDANITIEYRFAITNIGEIPGYAQKIVDYIPEGLIFDPSENKDWVEENGQLINTTLSNEIINSGETKVLTLKLKRQMSQNGFGTISNEVEIEQMYNANGEEDLNTDNDISKADVIIGVRTGKMVLYVTLTLMVLAILSIGIYFIRKKVIS